MEVVLLENIKNLGQIGDVVKVKRGHGRNFLIKYGKALQASKENIDLVNKKKAVLNEKNTELKKNAKKIHDIINSKKYKFSKRAKENEELFGSINPKELARMINEQKKVEIKKIETTIQDGLFVTVGNRAITKSDIVIEIKIILILNN